MAYPAAAETPRRVVVRPNLRAVANGFFFFGGGRGGGGVEEEG